MRYCQFCGAEVPIENNTCPNCGRNVNDNEKRTVRDVIWPKGGGNHPAARLMRILAQVTFWGGVLCMLSIGNERLWHDLSFTAMLSHLIGFLPVTGVLLGLAEVIELLDRRNRD